MGLLAWGARGLKRPEAVLLVLGVAGLIFITLKASFVRQDAGHELEAIGAAALAFLVSSAWLPDLLAPVAAFTGVFILTGSLNMYAGPGGLQPAIAGLRQEVRGLRILLFDPAQFAGAYARAVARIAVLPWHPAGTSDIYSDGQSTLLASGLTWAPRPVFQSYSAYTPSLERMNAQHLAGAGAADNIFFRPEPVDNHFPALDDGASWPALLSLYAPAGYDSGKDLVWLRRSLDPTMAVPGQVVRGGQARMGQSVVLPDAKALWAVIDVTPTLAGRVAGILAKTPLLHLVVKLSNGDSREYGFVPGMGPAGFLISPLVTTTWDFIHLRQAGRGKAGGLPRVVSFDLDIPDHYKWLWQHKYRFTVAPIAFPPLSGPALAELPGPTARALPPVVARPTCYLDEANGAPMRDAPLIVGASLQVEGWGAFDAKAGLAADAIALGFVNAAGKAWSIAGTLGPNAGIGAYFHHPSLVNVGLKMGTDPSGLPPGTYRVDLFLSRAGQTIACPTRLSITVPAG